MTDLPEFLPLMEYNTQANMGIVKESSGKLSAEALVWGEDVSRFLRPKLIVLADCIYYEEVMRTSYFNTEIGISFV